MKYDVKTNESSRCGAEGKHRGFVVKVFGKTDIRTDGWRVDVFLQKLGDYGEAPTTEHKLETTNVSGSADDVFQLGFAKAEREINSRLGF